jgi:hypothetical protein
LDDHFISLLAQVRSIVEQAALNWSKGLEREALYETQPGSRSQRDLRR